ncbi:MAG: ATP-binding cassette domain-containing protein [Desulforhopalus sp.]
MSAVIEIHSVSKYFDGTRALSTLNGSIESGRLTGLVGPDGAGKTTLMRMMTALMVPTEGTLLVGGYNVSENADAIHTITGYMPQRFGLYEDLAVIENLNLYADLQGLVGKERQTTFERLLHFTRLSPFKERPAGKLSGGMKQKLGLACALMGKPKVLLLDEPSVGVDPVSRQDLWKMVQELTSGGMAVVWSTAYLDEAERCEEVLLLNNGQLEYSGPPKDLTSRIAERSYTIHGKFSDRRATLSEILELKEVRDGVIQGQAIRIVLDTNNDPRRLEALVARESGRLERVAPRFEDAFIDLLGGGPGGRSAIAEKIEPVQSTLSEAVKCSQLTKIFGTFTATDNVSFTVKKGEIFGLLGPNGAGKSTTFKMLCGLLRPTYGEARVAGFDLRSASSKAKLQLGYMAQKFSLYGLLSVRQNLEFFSGVYQLSGKIRRQRIEEMIETFDLHRYLKDSPDTLPLGYKQRLAFACALMHRPAVLFLDEPTSGVDPITRREFWTHINGLVRKGVTVLVTTHFMDEAEYCDRIALMYHAKVIALNTPDQIKEQAAAQGRAIATMEDAFIAMVESADDVPGGI